MDVSVIIVNYNTFAITLACIRSVIRCTQNTRFEIVLVDNASTECDANLFLKEFPNIILVKSDANGGFAYGNNLGIAKASGNYILLLNSDTYLNEDSISKSLDYMRSHTDVGVLGCRMVYPLGNVQFSARKFRSIGWEVLDFFRFVPLMMSYQKRSRLMLGKYFHGDETLECDWVNGAYFMFQAGILRQLPDQKLDERFFMYGEDQLWCVQIKSLGYKIIFYAGTTIIHIHNASTRLDKQLALQRVMLRNELAIMRARKGRSFYYFIFKLIYGFKENMRILLKAVIFRLSRKMVK